MKVPFKLLIDAVPQVSPVVCRGIRMKVHMGVRAGAFAADFHVYLFSVGGAACRTAIFQSDL